MTDKLENLQRELQTSLYPVSAFFLIDSPNSLSRMVNKLRSLCPYGVTSDQISAMSELAARILNQFKPDDDFEETIKLDFSVGTETRRGDFQIRNAPGHGFEVELILPGIVASTASGFLDNGFWTVFLPPSFYD